MLVDHDPPPDTQCSFTLGAYPWFARQARISLPKTTGASRFKDPLLYALHHSPWCFKPTRTEDSRNQTSPTVKGAMTKSSELRGYTKFLDYPPPKKSHLPLFKGPHPPSGHRMGLLWGEARVSSERLPGPCFTHWQGTRGLQEKQTVVSWLRQLHAALEKWDSTPMPRPGFPGDAGQLTPPRFFRLVQMVHAPHSGGPSRGTGAASAEALSMYSCNEACV